MKALGLFTRNLKETYREPLALAFLLGFPLVFMLLFGAIFGGDNGANYAVGVVDADKTAVSQAFVGEALASVRALKIVKYSDEDTARKDLQYGDLDAYVVIPAGFGAKVTSNWQGTTADMTLAMTYDESNVQTSQELISIVNAVARDFARIEIPVKVVANPIRVDTKITYIDFIAPGIIVFGLLIMIPTSARVIVRDRETGFLARLLTTPIRPWDFLLGYSLCLVVIAIAQIIIFMTLGYWLGMSIVGSVWLAFLIFFLVGLCSIGIGMVVGSLSRTEHQAEPLCWLISMPLAMLSGSWFSIEMMPMYLRRFADIFPYAHAIDAARRVLSRGIGLAAVSGDLIFLAVWAVVIFIIGTILFRRSMRS
jgi:ABC-2 type transport system permease protein